MNAITQAPGVLSPVTSPNEWQAFLNLHFARTSRGVRLVEKSHQGPLYIQKPFYPEGFDLPHAYILHPPGGLVSGDTLTVTVDVAPESGVLVTTPGAGRMYKARDQQFRQRQNNIFNVGQQSSLEWLPLEAIVFPDANADLNTEVHLAGSAKCICWDVVSLGLPANKQSFLHGTLNQNLKIYQNERLVLQDRFVVNDSNRALLNANVGLQMRPVQGLCVAGPFTTDVEDLVTQIREHSDTLDMTVGITEVSGFIVIRALHHCSEQLRKFFERAWAMLRPVLLGRPACPPRIWNT